MLEVRRLWLLRELDRRGTIAAVAQEMMYTPSAVSQQLSILEREAGVKLLKRDGRRVILTTAGMTLVEHAELVLAGLEQAESALAAHRSQLSGPLRIGAFPTAVSTLLSPALVALGKEYPALELMVDELDPAMVPDALRSRKLDLALVHDYDFVVTKSDSALDSVLLAEEAMYLASTREGAVNSIREFRDEPWILGSEHTLCHTMAVRACESAGFIPRARHHADDFSTVLALVAAGQGVALVPQLATIDAPPGVVLTPLSIKRRIRVAFRRGARKHPAVSACVAALRESASAYPWLVVEPQRHRRARGEHGDGVEVDR